MRDAGQALREATRWTTDLSVGPGTRDRRHVAMVVWVFGPTFVGAENDEEVAAKYAMNIRTLRRYFAELRDVFGLYRGGLAAPVSPSELTEPSEDQDEADAWRP